MIDDIFCKIINKELPAEVVMEEEGWIAINDIHPQAPVHVLIISKKHFDISAATEEETLILGKLILAADKIAQKLGLEEKGYRLIINRGEDSGQLVPHMHVHFIGGKKLGPKIVGD